ncbi:NAD+ synthase [Fluoribacter dumoffii]|uniref:NAD+ synthase n=1 Tax=Fluoribacter dumoffii TaxID=463 RepID=UPI00026C75F3|nr:NAD+ synthase [Fluoribacter dumoffii]MCW8384871.1 NAD+ synthase [Fluoribacter dumoffii]MCW8417933.1 NAD+ synthase [Fluoribacter dumoffii]MCW8454225.1 NAD+ synthase [Fluoribacter dumoffii]MCW8461701.1 NAD+ synthase [Fluoribacter dumoffii]MCW8481917.1 NAD+ synthase [Fluoribacter dumoffii]
MQNKLTVLMAQINPTVGALVSNRDKIIDVIKNKQAEHNIILFPELALTGYPPEDLLFRKEFQQAVSENLKQIQEATKDCYVLVGHPSLEKQRLYNSVSIFYQGQKIAEYHKQNLPNYEIFDEARYFTPGKKNPCILEVNHSKVGVIICEDLWHPGPAEDLIENGISLLLILNASPFDYTKYQKRESLLKSYAKCGIAIIYVNQIGGQDELLFDGQSLAIDSHANVCARSPAFEEDLRTVVIEAHQVRGEVSPLLDFEPLIYKSLVCGTRDYVTKNHFPGVLVGLSGGVDSALTLAVAADALGAERVHAVLMPSRYTASMSNEDALIQIEKLKVSYSILSIEPAFNALMTTLASEFKGLTPDSTEENIQARIRGLLIMALSNKTGKMVLTTSNKSETAVGYATLYGDMAGGFAVLKDVLKTQVYALAHYRNSLSEIIPTRVLTRPPSAELRPDQTDQDSLPDYPTLDGIIVAYMEKYLSPEEIIQQGYAPETVARVIQLIKRNEYKRRQAAPGIKISPTAFGKDWRYPITNGF